MSTPLIAELHTQLAQGKTVSETAQTLPASAKLSPKLRDPTKYVKHMSNAGISHHKQVSIRGRRSYRFDNETDSGADVLFTTYAFFHTPAKRTFLSTEEMSKLRDEYLTKVAPQHPFTVKDVYTFFDITGSNRSDTPRESLKQVSLYISKAAAANLPEATAKATAAGKQCLFYNNSDSPKRKSYIFVKA